MTQLSDQGEGGIPICQQLEDKMVPVIKNDDG